jgi:hypothetical protein
MMWQMGSKSANAKPQSKPGAFDDTSHDPRVRQSLFKRLRLCNRPSRWKPCRGGPHFHYSWPYLGKRKCPLLQHPYDK